MLRDVRNYQVGRPCAILGVGHTILDERLRVDNPTFIRHQLSQAGQLQLLRSFWPDPELTDAKLLPRLEEIIPAADAKFREATGIQSRLVWPGTLVQLATQAAQSALDAAGVRAKDIDVILVGTNTPDEYNIANGVKSILGASVGCYCNTMMAACPVGANVVYAGWKEVRLGAHHVLVIGAEMATTLASADAYKAANLFGDAAFAMVLGPGECDEFTFFAYASDPFDDKISWIRKSEQGFVQDGPAVHKYVGTVIPTEIIRTLEALHIDPATVDHFFAHQASSKTNDLLVKSLIRRCPAFRAQIHTNVAEMGNTSAASTGWMISRAMAAGQLKPGQFCLVATFGAGISYSFYGFTVS